MFFKKISNLVKNNNIHINEINLKSNLEESINQISNNIKNINLQPSHNIKIEELLKKYNEVKNKLKSKTLENKKLKNNLDLSVNNTLEFSKRLSFGIEKNDNYFKIPENDILEALKYIDDKINSEEFEINIIELIQNQKISFQQKFDKINDLFKKFYDYINSLFKNIKQNKNVKINEFFITEEKENNDTKKTIKSNNKKINEFDFNHLLKNIDFKKDEINSFDLGNSCDLKE